MIAGFVIVLGAVAYRSAKKRRLGEVKSTTTRQVFEIVLLAALCGGHIGAKKSQPTDCDRPSNKCRYSRLGDCGLRSRRVYAPCAEKAQSMNWKNGAAAHWDLQCKPTRPLF